jgi:hypothetical protein
MILYTHACMYVYIYICVYVCICVSIPNNYVVNINFIILTYDVEYKRLDILFMTHDPHVTVKSSKLLLEIL